MIPRLLFSRTSVYLFAILIAFIFGGIHHQIGNHRLQSSEYTSYYEDTMK